MEKLSLRLEEIDAMQAALVQQRTEVAAMIDNLREHWAADDCIAMGTLVEQALTAPGDTRQRKSRRTR